MGELRVIVKLFGGLRRYAPAGDRAHPMILPAGASVGDVLKQLNIPATVGRLILVNGRRADEKAPVSPDDEVVLMPPIEGG